MIAPDTPLVRSNCGDARLALSDDRLEGALNGLFRAGG